VKIIINLEDIRLEEDKEINISDYKEVACSRIALWYKKILKTIKLIMRARIAEDLLVLTLKTIFF
jgi:hypothetical protein